MDDGGAQVDPQVLVLGPVGVRCGEEWRSPRSGVLRALLAALALAAGRGVGQDELMATVWRGKSRGSTAGALAVAVHRLRRWLRDTVGSGVVVDRVPAGYRLTATGGTDVSRFRQLVAEASRLDAAARAQMLGRAAALWRGPAMADVPAGCVDIAAAQLERERIDAARDRAAALVASGGSAEAVTVLVPETDRYPLDESLQGLLMEALAAVGRQAEAFEVFERIRGALADKLGVDPGSRLREAHLRILRQQPPDAPEMSGEPVPPPAQLPAGISMFTGRER